MPEQVDEPTEKIICPNCGEEVSAYLVKCPKCGNCLTCQS